MALEDQMSMNFGDIPDNTVGVDPVSGNDIPLGSSAENVRDDIPAQLSEGEIVIPADVVRFHGVKLFEDLRAAAKMGYAQMNEDGRIGGEPIPMDMDDEGLELDLSDLEVVEMAEGGDTKGAYTFDKIKKKVVRREKPVFKNNFEKIMYNLFGDKDDDKPTKTRAVDKPGIDFGFGGNPMERAARKYGSPSEETKNKSYRPDSSRKKTSAEQRNFFGFDDGGLTVSLEGKTGRILPEGYDPAVDSLGGSNSVMEMREYQNSAGHTIMIPFLDGVPQTIIPDGYYPVGSTPVTVVNDNVGGSSDDDGPETPTPEPYNYNELSIDELAEEVKNVNASIPMGGIILNSVFSVFRDRHKKNLIKEIDRRLNERSSFNNPNDPTGGSIPIYEKEYLENLLEVVKAPAKKGLLGKTIDQILGKEPEEETDLPKLDGPEFTDETAPQSNEPYKPTVSAPNDPSPDLAFTPERMAKINAIIDDTDMSKVAGAKLDKVGPTNVKIPGNDDDDDGPAFRPPTPAPKPSPIYDNVAAGDYNDDSTGVHKGALIDKPKVKKVVKGLKKASKLHAEQAKTLEEEVKKKSK